MVGLRGTTTRRELRFCRHQTYVKLSRRLRPLLCAVKSPKFPPLDIS